MTKTPVPLLWQNAFDLQDSGHSPAPSALSATNSAAINKFQPQKIKINIPPVVSHSRLSFPESFYGSHTVQLTNAAVQSRCAEGRTNKTNHNKTKKTRTPSTKKTFDDLSLSYDTTASSCSFLFVFFFFSFLIFSPYELLYRAQSASHDKYTTVSNITKKVTLKRPATGTTAVLSG